MCISETIWAGFAIVIQPLLKGLSLGYSKIRLSNSDYLDSLQRKKQKIRDL